MSIYDTSGSSKDSIYFASKEGKETASVLLNKAKSFYNVLEANAYLEKLGRMYRAYYGQYDSGLGYGHQINFAGEQGELVRLPVNHFRNLAEHIHRMITANRPIMEARAINTDYKSMSQTILANGILDYYMREKGLETVLKKAAEMAIVLGAGFVKLEWNATAGETYDVDEETGTKIQEGEAEFSNLSPYDVVVDGSKESWNNDWILVRGFKNKYDLMAKYPELADKIKGVPTKNDASIYRLGFLSNDETDDIAVYEFYHKKTEAMPDGRYMLFLDADIVMIDAPMPYRVLPIFRVSAGDIMGTPYGYSSMFDVFPIQEGINALYSTVMTNHNAFGVQNLFVQRGADLTVDSLQGGMNIIEGNAPPTPLNLTQTPPEIFNFIKMLIDAAETISGVNSVARGNPEASLKSGTALALVQSMALQFVSGLQQNYVKLIEDVGTALIQILKDYANTPKVVALVGKHNKTLLKEFTGENISAINRVVVDVGNPLSRTIAGRAQMADQMMQMKLIKDPTQYFQVINTGRLDTIFEGDLAQQLLIRQENECLIEASEVIVSPFDYHQQHIQEHAAVLADPELRKDPELVRRVHDHIQGHVDSLRTTDPFILELMGQIPAPPPGTSMNEPGQPYSNQSGGGGGGPMQVSQGQQVQVEEAGMPQMPTPPAPFENNPTSAEQLPTQ